MQSQLSSQSLTKFKKQGFSPIQFNIQSENNTNGGNHAIP